MGGWGKCGGCFASHRNRCSQAGREAFDLYVDLIWQSQWGRRIPCEAEALTILEEAALTSNLRLPLFLIIRSLDFRNRIAHVVLWLGRWVCSEIEFLFLVLIEGDCEWDVIFMDKIEDNSLFHCSSRNIAATLSSIKALYRLVFLFLTVLLYVFSVFGHIACQDWLVCEEITRTNAHNLSPISF